MNDLEHDTEDNFSGPIGCEMYDPEDYPGLIFPCQAGLDGRGSSYWATDWRVTRVIFEPVDNVIEDDALGSTSTFLGGTWHGTNLTADVGQRWFCMFSNAPSEWVVVDRFDFASTRPAPKGRFEDKSGGTEKAVVILKIAYCPLQPKPHEIARINLLIQGNRPALTLEELEAEYDR